MDATERLNEITRLLLEREKATSMVSSIDRKIAEVAGIESTRAQRKSGKNYTSNQFRAACEGTYGGRTQ